jgi:hypothetical protein
MAASVVSSVAGGRVRTNNELRYWNGSVSTAYSHPVDSLTCQTVQPTLWLPNMASPHPVLPDEIKRAKWPHEIFLINLVFNHILVFASTFGVYSTFPLMVLVVPSISLVIITYIEIRSRQVQEGKDSEFIKAHWWLAHKRNRQFMGLLAFAAVLGSGGYAVAQLLNWSKVTTIAILGGFGLLPFMVSLLVLIVLGNAAMYEARHNKMPKGYPENAQN